MVAKLIERLKRLIIPQARPCHASLKYPCTNCGEAFPMLEALASHIVYKHRGVKLPYEASQACLEHWAVLFPRWYVKSKYARTDC